MEGIVLPVYIINLPNRPERLRHSLRQFEGRDEFDVNVIEATYDKIGALGLWKSIKMVIRNAIEKDEDMCIICEDDHTFTESYSRNRFIMNILEAHRLKAAYLLGGITGGFSNMLVLPSGLCWLDAFWGTQFVVVFKSFYERILNEDFLDSDVADAKFSEMTSNKFVIYPMISHQTDFGYSDVTDVNASKGHIEAITSATESRMERLVRKSRLYRNGKI